MEHLLPEVVDRPLSIIRCPSGTAKPCFFQKHHTAGLELVDPVRLKEESGINAHYLVVRDAASLLELVQFNALEFHPWGSHAEAPDKADRVVFDLIQARTYPLQRSRRRQPTSADCWRSWSWNRSCVYPAARACTWWCRSTRDATGT